MQSSATLTLAENVKALMQRAGNISQVELARRSGVSKSALGYLLNYRDAQDRHATTQTVEAVAKAFGLEPWQLLAPNLGEAVAVQAPAIDAALLAKSLTTAMDAFRAQKRMPADQHLAAAAAYVYTYVSTGKRMKEAEKAVQKLLEKAGDSAPSFADLH